MTDINSNQRVFNTLKSALSLANSIVPDITLNILPEPHNRSSILVGREDESDRLRNFIEQHLSNDSKSDGGTIYVSGLPGTGKSAVVLQTVDWIKSRSLQCIYMNCMRTLSSRPSGLFAELLASWETHSVSATAPAGNLSLSSPFKHSIAIDSNDNCIESGQTPKRRPGRPRKSDRTPSSPTTLSEDDIVTSRARSSARSPRRASPSTPASTRTPSKLNSHPKLDSTPLQTPIKFNSPRTPKTTPRSKVSNVDALVQFEAQLESFAARSQHLVVVLDEVDFLASFSNSLKALRTLILMTARLPLVLIAVANRLDLLDRILVAPACDRRSLSLPSTPTRSRGAQPLNVTVRDEACTEEPQLPAIERLSFAPYTADQLYAILSAKLTRAGLRVGVGPSAHFDMVALRVLTKRVAAHFGDVRKAAEVALLAVEAAERTYTDALLDENDAQQDVSPTKRSKCSELQARLGHECNAPQPRIQAKDVCRVLDAALATAATASFTACVPNARSAFSHSRKNLMASGSLAALPEAERASRENTQPEPLFSPTRNASTSLSQMTLSGASAGGLVEKATCTKPDAAIAAPPLKAMNSEQNSSTAVGLLPLQQKIVLCTLLSMLDQMGADSRRGGNRALNSAKHQLNCTFAAAASTSSKKSVDALSTSFVSLDSSTNSPVTVLPFDRLLAACKKVWSSLELLAELAPKTAGELREACALLETSGIVRLIHSRSAPLKVRLEADPRDLRLFLLERDHRDMHLNKKILHLVLY